MAVMDSSTLEKPNKPKRISIVDNKHPPVTILPIFRCRPAFVSGIPVARDIRLFAAEIPVARFQLKEAPGMRNFRPIFHLNSSIMH